MSRIRDLGVRSHRDDFLLHHVLDQNALEQRRLAPRLEPENLTRRRPNRSLSLNKPTNLPSSTTGIWRIRPREITSLAKSNVSSGFKVTGLPIMISRTIPSLPFFIAIPPRFLMFP